MKVDPKFVDALFGVHSYNAAVTAATAEDFLALYRYARDLKLPIHTIVLGVDATALSEGIAYDGRTGGIAPLAREVPEVRNLRWWWHHITTLFSLRDLSLSIRSIRFALTSYPPARMNFDPHGFGTWDPAPGSFRFQAELDKSIAKYVAAYNSFTALSPRRERFFTELLDECRRDGTRVFVYMTPLHPRLLQAVRERAKYPQQLERASRWIAQQVRAHGGKFFDATEIERRQGEGQFYDGVHPRPKLNERILGRLAGGTQPRRGGDAVQ